MKLLALLTKEMRLRMRRERTIWVLVTYIVLLGFCGWLALRQKLDVYAYNGGGLNLTQWNQLGESLYQFLILAQLLVILLVTPAFTAGAINGEKERQTFDLLLCSRISSFALVVGKLCAGLSNAFLLIVASLPLFSLVVFFGGVNVQQIGLDLLALAMTALVVALCGLLCSIIFPRPAISTVVTYLLIVLWVALPIVIMQLTPQNPGAVSVPFRHFMRGSVSTLPVNVMVIQGSPIAVWMVAVGNNQPITLSWLYVWDPLLLVNGYSPSTLLNGLLGSGYYMLQIPGESYVVQLAGWQISPWQAYMGVSAAACVLLFVFSLLFVKPHLLLRIRRLMVVGRSAVRRGTSTTVTA